MDMELSTGEIHASVEPGHPTSIVEVVVRDYSCNMFEPALPNPPGETTMESESEDNEQRGEQKDPSGESSAGDSSSSESTERKSDGEDPTAASSPRQNSPDKSIELDSEESPVSESEISEETKGSNPRRDSLREEGEQVEVEPENEKGSNPNPGEDKQPTAVSEETALDPEKQVQAFTTEKELFPLLRHLKRIPLAELREDSDLENGYIGGKVMAQCLQDTSQGRIEILVTDDSLSPKHITCYLEGDITNLYPQQSGMEYRLYLHRVEVDSMFIEYSQDFELCVNVRGDEPRLWVVHQDAKLRHFLPGGSRRKSRKRKKMKWPKSVTEVGVDWKQWAERNRPHGEEAEEVGRAVGDQEQQAPTVSTADDAPAEATHSQTVGDNPHADPNKDTSNQEKPKNSQTSSQQSTFPDNFDLPDSALRDYHTDEGVPSDDKIPSRSSICSWSSSESESEDDDPDGRDEEWEPNSKRQKVGDTGRNYEYKKIADLKVNDKKMNMFGVVTDFKPPFQTRGADYCCFVTIADESCPDAGIKCVLFNQSQDKLPQVKSVGDILCLHRVNITERNSSPSVEGTPFSSYLCFDGKPNSKLKPRTGSFSYTFMSQDKARVKELRQWAAEREKNKSSSSTCTLQSVIPDTSFDLTCQVISVTPCLPQCCASVLTVWDGTKFPLRNRKIDVSAYRAVSHPELQHAAGLLAENVVVYDERSIDAATFIKLGQFVGIQNVKAAVTLQNGGDSSSALVELCVPRECSNGNCCVKVLAESDPNVLKLKEELKKIVNKPLADCESSTLSVTTTLHPTVPLMSLDRIHSWGAVPSKFRCRVSVSAISPSSVEEMVKLTCPSCGLVAPIPHNLESGTSRIPCPECNELDLTDPNDRPALGYAYLFKLMIQDSTGELVVYVSEEDAVTFLPGLPPANLYRDQELRYKLLNRLYYLTGGNSPFTAQPSTRPRPWVECCILSYHHKPQSHSSSVLYYRIFDTILKDPQL